jgi:hypothetical protein
MKSPVHAGCTPRMFQARVRFRSRMANSDDHLFVI